MKDFGRDFIINEDMPTDFILKELQKTIDAIMSASGCKKRELKISIGANVIDRLRKYLISRPWNMTYDYLGFEVIPELAPYFDDTIEVRSHIEDSPCNKPAFDFKALKLHSKSMEELEEITMLKKLEIKKVIYNPPTTIVYWQDGGKTIVKAQDEPFDQEKGLAMAMCKRMNGNKGNYNNIFKKWCSQEIKVKKAKEKKTGLAELREMTQALSNYCHTHFCFDCVLEAMPRLDTDFCNCTGVHCDNNELLKNKDLIREKYQTLKTNTDSNLEELREMATKVGEYCKNSDFLCDDCILRQTTKAKCVNFCSLRGITDKGLLENEEVLKEKYEAIMKVQK